MTQKQIVALLQKELVRAEQTYRYDGPEVPYAGNDATRALFEQATELQEVARRHQRLANDAWLKVNTQLESEGLRLYRTSDGTFTVAMSMSKREQAHHAYRAKIQTLRDQLLDAVVGDGNFAAILKELRELQKGDA
jgi:hypothetical protein